MLDFRGDRGKCNKYYKNFSKRRKWINEKYGGTKIGHRKLLRALNSYEDCHYRPYINMRKIEKFLLKRVGHPIEEVAEDFAKRMKLEKCLLVSNPIRYLYSDCLFVLPPSGYISLNYFYISKPRSRKGQVIARRIRYNKFWINPETMTLEFGENPNYISRSSGLNYDVRKAPKRIVEYNDKPIHRGKENGFFTSIGRFYYFLLGFDSKILGPDDIYAINTRAFNDPDDKLYYFIKRHNLKRVILAGGQKYLDNGDMCFVIPFKSP